MKLKNAKLAVNGIVIDIEECEITALTDDHKTEMWGGLIDNMHLDGHYLVAGDQVMNPCTPLFELRFESDALDLHEIVSAGVPVTFCVGHEEHEEMGFGIVAAAGAGRYSITYPGRSWKVPRNMTKMGPRVAASEEVTDENLRNETRPPLCRDRQRRAT